MHTIIRPIITEASMAEAEKGRFSFVVAKTADKPTIRNAVEAEFGVQVIGIMTAVSKGKTRRTGKNRTKVARTAFKKAIVQLKEGQKISLFDLGGK